jgi:drug/metabolite transporter (DMT)-like permease
MRNYIAEIGLVITAVIWGSGFVASAIALEHYTPYQIMAIRFFVGAVVLLLLFYKKLGQIKKSTLIKGTILGVILYLAFALQTVGLVYTTPSKNAFLTAVNVVIVPFIGLVFYKKYLSKFELTGAMLAIVGVGILSLHLPFVINIGDLLTLGCAILFALQIFYTSKFVQFEDAICLTLVQMIVAALCGVLGIFMQGELTLSYQTEALLPVLYLGVFSTSLAYVLQTIAQKYISETKTAIILSTESLWGMIFSIIILSEVITFRMAIGAVIILLAIFTSETKFSFLDTHKKGDVRSNR